MTQSERGCAVQVLHVRPQLPGNPARALGSAQVRAYYAEEAEKILKPARARLRKIGLNPTVRYVVGRPARDISAIADPTKGSLALCGSIP